MDVTSLVLVGAISGGALVYTLHRFFGPKLFWVAGGADIFITIVVPVIFAGTASGIITALATGVTFTVTLRVMNAFMPGEKLLFIIERGWPKLRWIPTPATGLPKWRKKAW